MYELLCTRKQSLKNLIRSWKSPGILFLHGSMSPVIYTPGQITNYVKRTVMCFVI